MNAVTSIAPEGPWKHEWVAANGSRFHIVQAGSGPLVLLLHGFPTYWWSWRRLIPALADSYRVVAMDLRGYGASDHPPRGYDPTTLAADVAGVIRSLGERQAFVVGQGWGGFLAWTTAALHPELVSGIAVESMPHPIRLREAFVKDTAQRKALSYAVGFQRPWIPERRLVADRGQRIGDYLREWSASDTWLTDDVIDNFQSAFCHSNTAHCALEYHRWAVRSVPRPDGARFIKSMRAHPIKAPVLHVQGESDPCILPSSALGSDEFVEGDYRLVVQPGVGHFPHEERFEEFNELLRGWLAEVTGAPARRQAD